MAAGSYVVVLETLGSQHFREPSTKGWHESVSYSVMSNFFATWWIVVHQDTLSMKFSRQEYWSALPFPFPGDPSWPGFEPESFALQAGSLPSELPGKPTGWHEREVKVSQLCPTLCLRWPKYWSFSFSIIPSKEIPGLISLGMDWLDLLEVQGTLKSILQHHSSKASILQCSAFFTVQSHIHTWPQEKP